MSGASSDANVWGPSRSASEDAHFRYDHVDELPFYKAQRAIALAKLDNLFAEAQ
ncbi:MAG: hypothetical protein KDJ65_27070 [Anaerolineae bacterium]|nr:hypothetical protein [Anaerolineae bacterium]